ncbi:MAG TPA: branched-chain amino acid ABC transporter permease [Nocardioidaceae bacterium]|nr:branched-chain amino acid ABC transporter permease [Nocardioidaceae bacterium]
MQVRVGTVLALVLGVLGVTLLTPAAALGAPPQSVPVTSTVLASPEDEGPLIQGRLIDETGGKSEPVEGVEITVLDDSGTEIGTATSDAEGAFAIPVPGSGTYTVRVDEETLPEGTRLRNPDDVENTVTISGFDKTVLFPIGPDNRQVTGLSTEIVELTVGGILFGLILALSALGLSMIYGTTGLTNFAHGELVTFGALVALILNVSVGLPVILAGVFAVIVAALFGWLQDTFLWRRLRHRGTGLVAMMIVAIGMAIFLRALWQYIIGGNREAYTDYVTQQPIIIGPISMPPRDMLLAATAFVVLMVVILALQRTKMGKAMRAVADNPPLAASSGINVDRVISMVWIGGTALAALGGFLYTIKYQMDYNMGLRLLLLIFAAVILGGIGTIWGALIGSLVVALFTELSTLFIPAELKYTGALFVMIVILLFRPQGIMGRAQRVG